MDNTVLISLTTKVLKFRNLLLVAKFLLNYFCKQEFLDCCLIWPEGASAGELVLQLTLGLFMWSAKKQVLDFFFFPYSFSRPAWCCRVSQDWNPPVMLSSLSLGYRALTAQAEHWQPRQRDVGFKPTHLNAQVFTVKILFGGQRGSHKAAPSLLLLISTNT